MALILAAVMAVSCLTTILLAASKNWSSLKDLGALSQYYETGADADPGAVSTVPGDPGGTSFGLYMFSSKAGTLDAFRTWLRNYKGNTIYNGFAAKLDKAYGENTSDAAAAGYGPNFENAWRELGHGVNKGEFANAQTEYWGTERYSTLISRLQSKYPALDLNDYSIALKNVLWSRSVQHGVDGAYNVVTRAIDNRLGGFKMQSEAELIEAIYTECSKLAEDIPKYRDMQTQLSDRYGVKNRSMAYYSAADGDVQSSVYSRLHINEPADALVMRYQNTTSHLEGKYTLCYNSDGRTFSYSVGSTDLVAEEKASQLILTYYNSDKYTLATTDGKRLAVVDGALMLQNAAADSRQFWTLTGSNNGYILCNVGTGNYLTITVSQTQVADPNARTEPTEDEIAAKRAEITAEIKEKGYEEDGTTPVGATAKKFAELLSSRLMSIIKANFEEKDNNAIEALIEENIAKMGLEADANKKAALESALAKVEAIDENATETQVPAFTKSKALALIELFAGKTLNTIEEEVVADMVREDLKAKAANTTVTAYKVGLSKESKTAAVVTMKPAAGQDAWNTIGLFYPQKAEKDETGKSIVHNLTQGNSSFPLRGIVTCTQNISTIKAVVTDTATRTVPTYASRSGINAKWFDLWELDETLKFSKLSAGKYNLTITGTTDSDSTVTLLDTTFTVGAATTTTPEAPNNTYTVTFVVNGKTVGTRTYKEAQPYGALPEVDEKGFQGWFYNDREISQNTPVAPKNHTVTAKFGTLHTVKFMSQGAVWDSYKLAQNDIITLPATNPVMRADSKYVYSFDYWADASGKRYTSGTVMPDADVTYTAVFTKTANSGGGTGGSTGGNTGTNTPKPSGNYLTGVSPSTSVSAMNSAGYTIYSGSAKVTSGLVGTGMTAVSSSATVTIVVTGDVSGDGKITITDVVKLQKAVVGSGSLSGAYAKAADINGDGKVTITDVVQAAQVTVGQRTIG